MCTRVCVCACVVDGRGKFGNPGKLWVDLVQTLSTKQEWNAMWWAFQLHFTSPLKQRWCGEMHSLYFLYLSLTQRALCAVTVILILEPNGLWFGGPVCKWRFVTGASMLNGSPCSALIKWTNLFSIRFPLSYVSKVLVAHILQPASSGRSPDTHAANYCSLFLSDIFKWQLNLSSERRKCFLFFSLIREHLEDITF